MERRDLIFSVRTGILRPVAYPVDCIPERTNKRCEGNVTRNVHWVERRQPGGNPALRTHEWDRFHPFSYFHDSGSPGEAGAKSNESQMVAHFGSTLLQSFTESDGDRGGGGVAIPVDVHEYLLIRDAYIPSGAFDYARIGLVRDEEIDVLSGKVRLLNHLPQCFAQNSRGKSKYLSPIHTKIMESLIDCLMAGRHRRATRWQDQMLRSRAIRSKDERQHASRLVTDLKDDGSGAITKQYAG